MSNLIVDSSFDTSASTSLVKLIVFTIGKLTKSESAPSFQGGVSLTLALPILQVQKIIKQNQLHGSGLSHVHLAHLAEQDVAIVDLHQKLFGVALPQVEANGYFVISQNVGTEPLGIFVAQAPNLIDVPQSQIRILPSSYRHADTLEIASHVVLINQGETSETIFILDLAKLI